MILRSRFWLAAGILAVLGSVSVAAQTPSPDEATIARQFLGMWRLVSWPQRLADGTTRQVPLSVAYIIYTDTSPIRMCFVAMDPNRPKWNVGGTSGFGRGYAPTPDEVGSAFRGSAAYCGTVEVHAREGFVLHHIEIERNPNLVGLTRKRFFTFDGSNRVSLRIDPSENTAPVVESTLVWERVP